MIYLLLIEVEKNIVMEILVKSLIKMNKNFQF